MKFTQLSYLPNEILDLIVENSNPKYWMLVSKYYWKEMISSVKTTNMFGTTFYNGKLHSFNDRCASGSKYGGMKRWYRHGKLHRGHDKPAVVYYDTIMYYKNDIEYFPDE